MEKSRFLKIRRVIDRVSLSKSQLYVLIAQKQFPAPIKLGIRSSAWLESEIEAWMEARMAESRCEKNVRAVRKVNG